MNIKKIFNYLPSYPHHKMNVFSGTNSFSEVKKVFNLIKTNNTVEGSYIKEYEQSLNKKVLKYGCESK